VKNFVPDFLLSAADVVTAAAVVTVRLSHRKLPALSTPNE
jgi:hypothetical protein